MFLYIYHTATKMAQEFPYHHCWQPLTSWGFNSHILKTSTPGLPHSKIIKIVPSEHMIQIWGNKKKFKMEWLFYIRWPMFIRLCHVTQFLLNSLTYECCPENTLVSQYSYKEVNNFFRENKVEEYKLVIVAELSTAKKTMYIKCICLLYQHDYVR